MAQDFAKRKKASKFASKKSAPAPWRWLVVGVIIGLILAGFVFLQTHKSHAPSEKTSLQKQTKAHTFKFDFYTILPKMKVWEPNDQKPIATESGTVTINKTVPLSSYVLQIAAFKNEKDADSLRAKLTLLGYNAYIKKVTKNQITWNRVMIGPFQTLIEAQKTQLTLAKQNRTSLILKENI